MSSGSTTRLKPLAFGLCLAVLAVQAGSPAAAQSIGPNGGYGDTGRKDACTADYAKYCSGVDKFAFKQCLLDHQPDYSPACKAQRAAEREARMRREYNLPPAS